MAMRKRQAIRWMWRRPRVERSLVSRKSLAISNPPFQVELGTTDLLDVGVLENEMVYANAAHDSFRRRRSIEYSLGGCDPASAEQ